VGATVSDVAAFLIPVGPEEKAAGEVAKGAVDLAVPGVEDSTRIFKKSATSNAAEHFASEEEAKSVAEKLKDPKWRDTHCALCTLPNPAIVARSFSTMHRNQRRVEVGSPFGACCSPVEELVIKELEEIDLRRPDVQPPTSSDLEKINEPIEEDTDLVEDDKQWAEGELVPPPKYTVHSLDAPEVLKKDLDTLSTTAVQWSPEMLEIMDSKKLFANLRKVFTASPTDALYQALKIMVRDGVLRMTSFSNDWIFSQDHLLKPYKDFVNAAVAQANAVVEKLAVLEGATEKPVLAGNVEFFYTAPSEKALVGTDPRGFHSDRGIMQFAAQDTPGLLIQNTVANTASRVPVVADSFFCMKSKYWDVGAWLTGGPNGPTMHAVFGPEMAKEGRLSMVLHVFNPTLPAGLRK
jgi:hypothetical protein